MVTHVFVGTSPNRLIECVSHKSAWNIYDAADDSSRGVFVLHNGKAGAVNYSGDLDVLHTVLKSYGYGNFVA